MTDNITRRLKLRALAVACIAALASFNLQAQSTKPAGTQPTSRLTDRPTVISIESQPAAIPRPVFKYRLLPDLVTGLPGNAAPLYWTAIELLPSQKDKEFWETADKWVELSASDLPREAVRTALPTGALHLADLAARREYCHWEIPWRQDGISTLLPQLSPLRSLARLLVLRARVDIADGHFEDAAKSIVAVTALAKNLNDQPFLIQVLVSTGIEAMALTAVEDWIRQPGSPNLYWALTELPCPFADIKAGMSLERVWIYTEMPELRDAVDGAITAAQWDAVLTRLDKLTAFAGANGFGLTKLGASMVAAVQVPIAKKFLLAEGMSAAQVNALEPYQAVAAYWARDYEERMQAFTKWYLVPYAEGRLQLQKEEADFAGSRDRWISTPLTVLLPSLSRAYLTVTKLDRRIAALRCVEAVRAYASAHHGQAPASLQAITDLPIPLDPVTGIAFKYTSNESGFTLEGGAIGMGGDVLRYDVRLKK